MRNKLIDISLLLFGLGLALCLEYLSPYIRIIINNVFFRNIELCQRIQIVCNEIQPFTLGVIIVIAIAFIIVMIIAILIFKRHDKDDEIITILKQIRDRNTIKPGDEYRNHTKETKGEKVIEKPKTKKKRYIKGGRRQADI